MADFLTYLGACLALTSVLLALAIAHVRSVAIRHAARPALKQRVQNAPVLHGDLAGIVRRLLDNNPLMWKERHCRAPSRWGRWIWGSYFVLATIFSVFAVAARMANSDDVVCFVIGCQVFFGLLLVSISAVNSFAEERASGSLDVLLATPLSSAAILWPMWWATFRTVPRLAMLPWLSLCTVAAVNGGRHWEGSFAVIGLILAYGAASISTGLALATWTSHFSRAVAICVIGYVLATLGWPLIAQLVTVSGLFEERGLAMGSPAFGTLRLSSLIEAYVVEGNAIQLAAMYSSALSWGIRWIAIYLTGALILYLATWATFDRCLGRMTNRRRPRVPKRHATEREAAPLA
jgi:hypothetical protein